MRISGRAVLSQELNGVYNDVMQSTKKVMAKFEDIYAETWRRGGADFDARREAQFRASRLAEDERRSPLNLDAVRARNEL